MTDDASSSEFLRRLTVTQSSVDVFVGTCHPAWPGRAFGGQLAAQSLQAAAMSVPDKSLRPWSLNAYFHAPTAANEAVVYRVTPLKQGRTITTVQVSVEQQDRLRATVIVMFGLPGEGPSHQYQAPATESPETLAPVDRLLHPTVLAVDEDHVALGYPPESLIDMRIPDPDSADGNAFGPRTWMRVLAELPDDAVTLASALCYLSDITLGTTALFAHGGRDASAGLQLGALELSLWFTGGAALSEWTLFSQDSAFAGGGHALAHGVFYNAQSDVVAIALQNALMRQA